VGKINSESDKNKNIKMVKTIYEIFEVPKYILCKSRKKY